MLNKAVELVKDIEKNFTDKQSGKIILKKFHFTKDLTEMLEDSVKDELTEQEFGILRGLFLGQLYFLAGVPIEDI